MNLTNRTTALQKPRVPQHATPTKKTNGFSLIELLAVIAIGGVMAAAGAAYFSDAYKLGDVSYIASTADRLNQNWRLGNSKCATTSQIGVSPVTTTVGASNHLTLLVEGTGLNAIYKGCWESTGIEPARNAGIKGTGGVYTAQGYLVTIANVAISSRNRMAVTFKKVEDETVLGLIQKYGGQSDAATRSTVGIDDATDNLVRFATGTNVAGYHDVTLIE